jgi:hypothetical protein
MLTTVSYHTAGLEDCGFQGQSTDDGLLELQISSRMSPGSTSEELLEQCWIYGGGFSWDGILGELGDECDETLGNTKM